MLQNLNSGPTALSETEIEHFGVDPNGVLAVGDEDYQVEIPPPFISLSDEQLSHDGNGGKICTCNALKSSTCFSTRVKSLGDKRIKQLYRLHIWYLIPAKKTPVSRWPIHLSVVISMNKHNR